MNKNTKIGITILILTAVAAVFAYTYQNRNNEGELTTENPEKIEKQITLTSKIEISEVEKDQLKISVDAFMNEYKLPKGVPNSYIISIEERLNNSVKMTVNPGLEGDLGNIIIYARKIDGAWQVDPSGGPWCTLEEFENGDC